MIKKDLICEPFHSSIVFLWQKNKLVTNFQDHINYISDLDDYDYETDVTSVIGLPFSIDAYDDMRVVRSAVAIERRVRLLI